METTDTSTFFTVLKNTVEAHGCTIETVDFDRQIVNLRGSDAAMADCAQAIADLLD